MKPPPGPPQSKHTNHTYLIWCLVFLASTVMNGLNLVATQLLDGVAGVSQLSFGMFTLLLGMLVCSLLYHRRGPKPLHKLNLLYMIPAVLTVMSYVVFAFLASIHIAVGTLNAVLEVSFILGILVVSLLKDVYHKVKIQKTLILLNVTAVALISVGVIFIVQPVELFSGVEYFNNNGHFVYTSLCHGNRFQNISSANSTNDNITNIYLSQSWQGYMFAMMAGLGMAAKLFVIKTMVKLDDIKDILFWKCLIVCGIFLIISAFQGGFTFPHSSLCVFLIGAHALTGGLSYFFYFTSLVHIPSVDAGIMFAFVLPLMFIFQFTFLSEISPTPTNVVAMVAALVVFGAVIGKPLIQNILANKGYIQYDTMS